MNPWNRFLESLQVKKFRLCVYAQCLEHPWLLEQDIGHSVIKTDNLRKFLARRRWQRCGQAIRAMKRMSGKETDHQYRTCSAISSEERLFLELQLEKGLQRHQLRRAPVFRTTT